VAAEIPHRATIPSASDLAVPPGDGALVETDVALRLASHNVNALGQQKPLPLPRSGDGDKPLLHG
jgi:hypothetical protein